MKKILSTERLNLRELNLGDLSFIIEILNSPGWLNFIGDRGVRTMEDAEKYALERIMSEYTKSGFGLWVVEKKEDGTIIGLCGLIDRPGLDDIDIGFALLPDFGKKGYAFEAAAATMIYAKEVLQIPRVIAITTVKNKNSQQLLMKIGMKFEDMTELEGDDEKLMLYSIEF